MDNIVIGVVAETQGLKEAYANMDMLKNKEREILAQMEETKKQGNTATLIAKSAKEQSDAVQKFGASLEGQRKSLKSVRDEISEQEKSITRLSEAQKKMPGKIVAENTEKSFRQLRKEIENQVRAMTLAGETGTKEFQELIEKAGELNDIQGDVNNQIRLLGSDTRGFDSALEGTQMVAGGFQILQGSMALFGVENEHLMKAMVRLQAIMAVTSGLQQVGNILQKESALMTGIRLLQTKAAARAEALENAEKTKGVAVTAASTAATTAEAKAKTVSTVATGKATTAQKLFNLVAMANPYVLLAFALLTVVGVLALFALGTNKAEKEQKKLNEQNKINNDTLEKSIQKQKEANDRVIKDMESEVSLMRAKGASQSEIAQKEAEIAQKRVDFSEEQKKAVAQEIRDLDKNKDKVEELERAIRRMNFAKAQGNKKTTIEIDGVTKEVKVTDEAIENLQGQLDNHNFKVNVATTAIDNNTAEKQKQAEQDARERQRQLEQGRRSAQALADYRVAIAKKGSEDELTAQKAALQQRLKNELANIELTENERRLKRAETQRAIQDLEDNFARQRMQNDVMRIDALLATEKDFNIQVYNLRLARLEAQKQVDLSNAKDNAAQRELIEQNHIANIDKLQSEYFKNQAQTAANTEISKINTRLASVKAGSEEEKNLHMELAKEQAKIEEENARFSISNEEERAEKIKEIRAKLAKEIQDITLKYEIDTLQKTASLQELTLKEQYAKRLISKRKYESEMRNISIKSLEDEISRRRELGQETIELEKELSDKRIEITEEEAERSKEIAQELFNLVMSLQQISFDNKKAKLQQELDDLNHYYTTDVEAAKNNKNLKLISEEEMAKRQLDIKRRMAQADKQQALFTATIDGIAGVVKALSSAPPPYNIILAAITAAATAAQIAQISSKPLPKYNKGRRGGKGEFAHIHKDEIMWIPEGASIMPAHDSRRAMNGDIGMFEKWDMPVNMGILKSPVSLISKQAIDERSKHPAGTVIDYDKLGIAVAKYRKVPKQKEASFHVNMNEKGFGRYLQRGNMKARVLNARYN